MSCVVNLIIIMKFAKIVKALKTTRYIFVWYGSEFRRIEIYRSMCIINTLR